MQQPASSPPSTLRVVTGLFFVIASISFALAATALSASFDWPDILRESPSTILTRFQDGGARLIGVWFAVAWSYGLLLVPVLLLPRALGREDTPLLTTATFIGAVSVVASVIGFLRWVFVVPGLAAMYADPTAFATTREAVVAAFSAQHQFGGALLGEHIGQMLAVIWTVLVSVTLIQSALVPRWLGGFGLVAALMYLLNQGDILATVVPGFPVWDAAGLIGSVLWAVWLLLTGALLLWSARVAPAPRRTPVPAGAPLS